MGSIYDEIAQDIGVKLPSKENKNLIKNSGIVNGTLSKAWAPTVKKKPQSIFDEINGGEIKGEQVSTLDEVKTFQEAPKSIFDEIDDEYKINSKSTGTKTGEALFSRFGEVGKGVFTALSIDEHLIVKGIYKLSGEKQPKQDISDYNWGNFLKEKLKMEDSLTTNTLGVVMSIALSPSTYLTSGAAVGGKLGFKTMLSKKGVNLVNEIVSTQVAKETAKESTKLGRLLTSEESTKIVDKIRSNVDQQVLKKFGEINDFNKGLTVSKEVEAIDKSVKVSGKFRLEAPQFLGGGHFNIGDLVYQGTSLVKGENVAKYLKESGFLKASEKTLELSGKFGKSLDDFKLYAKDSALGELTKDIRKFFDTDVNVDNKLVEVILRHGTKRAQKMYETTKDLTKSAKFENSLIKSKMISEEAKFEQLVRESDKAIEKFFDKRLTKSEQTEFMDLMIKKSEESRKLLDEVRADTAYGPIKLELKSELASARTRLGEIKHENPRIQKMIDYWVGQGKFKGRKPLMDKFAERSKMMTGQELPIWVPGIIEGYEKTSIKMPQIIDSEAKRLYHTGRNVDGKFVDKYTRDPIKALQYRNAEIIRDNIHDEIYNNIIKNKLGGLTDKFSLVENGFKKAQQEGYVLFRHPVNDFTKADKFKETQLWIKKEFYDEYKKVAGNVPSNIPVISPLLRMAEPLTMAWKRNVTVNFPSFHAGNFLSNIYLNSMSIGGHAVDPRKWFKAAQIMSAGKKIRAGNLADDIVAINAASLMGKHSHQTKNAMGEILTDESLYREAIDHGVINSGFFKKDILGLHTDSETAKNFARSLQSFNPMRKWTEAMGNFGQAIETHARLINYQTWRMKGLSPRLAKLEVDKALFDYADLTGTEKLINNSLIPFYTFSKKNLSNHMRIINAKPGVPIGALKIIRDLGPNEEDVNGMFDWQKRRLNIKIGDTMVQGFKMPIEDIIEISQLDFLNRLGPVFKYGLEKGVLKKDIFTGRELSEVNNANEFKFAWNLATSKNQILKSFARGVTDFLDLKEDKNGNIIGDPDKLHILRNFVTGRYQSELSRLQREDKTNFDKSIRLMFGIIKFDPKDQEEMVRSKKMREVQMEMIEAFRKQRGAKTIPPIIADKYLNKEFKQYNKILESTMNAYEIEEEKKNIFKELESISEDDGYDF